MTSELLGVAFPWTARDRAALLEAFPTRTLPRTRPGSSLARCCRCDITLVVGPRLTATGLRVVCPICAFRLGMDGFWPR